jgi:hypothetical protein
MPGRLKLLQSHLAQTIVNDLKPYYGWESLYLPIAIDRTGCNQRQN